ncbi:MAG: nucleotide exchange factor GrpE [bacterium]|nr:nucleotide exchange factor GrpE [bacterium]
MSTQPRDIYVPAASWRVIVDVLAPEPRGMDPAFIRAKDAFERYSMTIRGDIGDAIQRCKDHLERFLARAQEIVESEAGETPGRLGRLKPFPYGNSELQFQVFNYKDGEALSLRDNRMAELMTQYDLFRETMRFMEKKVEEGNLGPLKNTFTFIHKPLQQAAQVLEPMLEKTGIERTTIYGEKPDPTYVHIAGDEPSDEFEAGTICRILKPGYKSEGREIQEGVVMIASKSA